MAGLCRTASASVGPRYLPPPSPSPNRGRLVRCRCASGVTTALNFMRGANEFMVGWRASVCPRRLNDFKRPQPPVVVSSLALSLCTVYPWKIHERNPAVIGKIITTVLSRKTCLRVLWNRASYDHASSSRVDAKLEGEFRKSESNWEICKIAAAV